MPVSSGVSARFDDLGWGFVEGRHSDFSGSLPSSEEQNLLREGEEIFFSRMVENLHAGAQFPVERNKVEIPVPGAPNPVFFFSYQVGALTFKHSLRLNMIGEKRGQAYVETGIELLPDQDNMTAFYQTGRFFCRRANEAALNGLEKVGRALRKGNQDQTIALSVGTSRPELKPYMRHCERGTREQGKEDLSADLINRFSAFFVQMHEAMRGVCGVPMEQRTWGSGWTVCSSSSTSFFSGVGVLKATIRPQGRSVVCLGNNRPFLNIMAPFAASV